MSSLNSSLLAKHLFLTLKEFLLTAATGLADVYK